MTDPVAGAPDETRIGSTTFGWGTRTYVMGIVNVTPDSFSGDGLLAGGEGTKAGRSVAAAIVASAVDQARAMVAQGADLLDVGGESTRPGHADVDSAEERRRVVPVIAAIRAALPDAPISIDTTKAAVAEPALDAGADAVNDVWGVAAEPALLALVAARGVPIVLMHNRQAARYASVAAEVVADLERAIARALEAGIAWSQLIVDPGIGFGKTADHNLALLADLAMLQVLRRPILLGTSRKSTIGHVLDLPPGERIEGTIATTVLGIAAGVDIVRVHDVRANVRAARMADAIVRRARSSPTQETRR
jgi:dihydropteroate synthase